MSSPTNQNPPLKIRPEAIVAGVALLAAGYDGKRMARYLNLRAWQRADIEQIKAKAVANLAKDAVLIDLMKAELAKATLIHAKAALVQSADSLSSASSLQAATVMGICIDKNLAIQGKQSQPVPQVNIALHVSRELESIDAQIRALTGGER